MQKENTRFDLLVIGSGPAGFAAASRALDFGKHVCIVEGGHIGGAGVMHGALTSKTMWELSSDYSVAGKVNRGYRASALSVDYDKVKKTIIQAAKERQFQMLSQIETFSRDRQVVRAGQKGSLTLVWGWAKFRDKYTVTVESDEGKKVLQADYFVIASGSIPRPHPDFAIDGERIFDSDTILNLKTFPDRMVIIGSGIIGCEYATIFSNFKQTEVHLLDKANRVIPFEDDDISDFVYNNLKQNGVHMHQEASLRDLRRKGDFLEVVLDYENGSSKVIEVDIALVAIGRMPNTKNLGLENIGLAPNARDFLEMNDYCDLNAGKPCHIYAAGDITGQGQLYNIAQHQGRYIARKIFSEVSTPITYKNMSTLMFFKPEVAVVGKNEKTLQAEGIPHRVAIYSDELVARNIAMRSTAGFVKIIVSHDGSHRILGMRAAGPQASSFIVSVAHLIGEKNGLQDVSKTVHPHPGVTEGLEECLRIFHNSEVFKKEAFPQHIKYREWKP